MRILHVSNLHLLPRFGSVPLSDWLGKRATGAVNFVLHRRAEFASSALKIGMLAELAREERVDAVLCTGDYTLWGTEHELARARQAVQPLVDASPVFLTVPGNHDVYTHTVVREDRFWRHFGDLLESDLPDASGEDRWPVVRFIGDEAVAIAVSSAIPHRLPWRASGRVDGAQLEALRRLLREGSLRDRFVFVLTHHAPRLADGRPDRAYHGLEDADALLDVFAEVERGALLFGHVHEGYRLKLPGVRGSLFNAGSSTQLGSESFWLFELGPEGLDARRGVWDRGAYRLSDRAEEIPPHGVMNP